MKPQHRHTINKNVKNDKNVKKRNTLASIDSDFIFVMQTKFPDPRIDVNRELDKMKDWLKGKGITRKDYQATFRNWLRRAEDKIKETDPDKTKEEMTGYCPNEGCDSYNQDRIMYKETDKCVYCGWELKGRV